jgi:hypothetical protein
MTMSIAISWAIMPMGWVLAELWIDRLRAWVLAAGSVWILEEAADVPEDVSIQDVVRIFEVAAAIVHGL